ncbi:hypothetical protein BZG36_05518 [Bifiguratus adelaidae]|uniref:Uncharacterized protein n=1 Tax=Bifiguratus adelaidae TaxID=1938954 RepID=A0A261XTI3_9FUNG|nr:hypothetical protein BZG36_05518 [Bifiguratus adelaidae]
MREALAPFQTEPRKTRKRTSFSCGDASCKKRNENIYICSQCGHFGCGRHYGRHALLHFDQSRHPIVFELASRVAFWYAIFWYFAMINALASYICDEFIFPQADNAKLLEEARSVIEWAFNIPHPEQIQLHINGSKTPTEKDGPHIQPSDRVLRSADRFYSLSAEHKLPPFSSLFDSHEPAKPRSLGPVSNKRKYSRLTRSSVADIPDSESVAKSRQYRSHSISSSTTTSLDEPLTPSSTSTSTPQPSAPPHNLSDESQLPTPPNSIHSVQQEMLPGTTLRKRIKPKAVKPVTKEKHAVQRPPRERPPTQTSTPMPPIDGMKGLRNLGNTCFMNSVLQSLSNTIPLREYLLKNVHAAVPANASTDKNQAGSSDKPIGMRTRRATLLGDFSMSTEFTSLLQEMWSPASPPPSPLPSQTPVSEPILAPTAQLTLHSSTSTPSLPDMQNNFKNVPERASTTTPLSSPKVASRRTPDPHNTITPTAFYSTLCQAVPHFRGYQQQDAQEFLRYFLDRMHNELDLSGGGTFASETDKTFQNDPYRTNTSIISTVGNGTGSMIWKIFGGSLWSKIRCKACSHQSEREDPFLDLSLDIPSRFAKRRRTQIDPRYGQCTIYDCLDQYTATEELAEEDKYMCPRCKVKRPCTKKFLIKRTPEILCLHLKRFSFTRLARAKIDSFVSFPLEALDLSSYTTDPRRPHLYDCFATVVHQGYSVNSGHYLSYVLDQRVPTSETSLNESQWYLFNDAKVSPVTHDQVASEPVYLLFYKRRVVRAPRLPIRRTGLLSLETPVNTPESSGMDGDDPECVVIDDCWDHKNDEDTETDEDEDEDEDEYRSVPEKAEDDDDASSLHPPRSTTARSASVSTSDMITPGTSVNDSEVDDMSIEHQTADIVEEPRGGGKRGRRASYVDIMGSDDEHETAPRPVHTWSEPNQHRSSRRHRREPVSTRQLRSTLRGQQTRSGRLPPRL